MEGGTAVGHGKRSLTRAAAAGFAAAILVAVGLPVGLRIHSASAASPCGPPVTSVIGCENTLAGDPSSDWQEAGAGDSTLQGFATSMSVNVGQTVSFRVKSTASAYHIDILRLGYYQGNGARKVAGGLTPSARYPQSQPSCLTDSTTGLIDCGNWGVSASWTVPTTAVSGVYLAHLVRNDNGGGSDVPFVVRNDSSHSDLVFQTSDETWEAYNSYGGNSLYQCSVACPPGNPLAYKGASKVSYNRPWHSGADDNGASWIFFAEYPMIRFLEANGYDLSYVAATDVDTGGALLANHKVFVSTGHDEYWSGNQRANVTSARDHGVDLAFFSGNEVFWKTRFEPSADGTNTPQRTLTSYKETHFDAPVDPQDPPTWSGTWEDPRFSPPADGGNPPNSLTGQMFLVNSGTTDIKVPATYSKLRLWRNTSVASLGSGQTLTLGAGLGTLGYEWDEDTDNGFRPAGLIDLSSTTSNTAEIFTDYGSLTSQNQTATHHLTEYRAPSGALVFGAGTVQWSWGLDNATTGGATDQNMQQATVNLLADMGAQPYGLISGLVAASRSTDTTAPTSAITSPSPGAGMTDGAAVTLQGTASDGGGGVVAGVEVSTDGGTTWHPATGTTSWSYTWIAHGNPSTTIKSRAVDDSGNLESPGAGISVNVSCPCSIWGSGTAPAVVDSGDASSVELGVKFTSDVAGSISGIRFYKGSTNTGTHIGNLWGSSGQLLASATFSGESGSGWQQVNFSSPVPIASQTTYIASYFAPKGHYSSDSNYFYGPPQTPNHGPSIFSSPPLHAVRSTPNTPNGIYTYGSTSSFPTSSYQAENYWVDPLYVQTTATVPGAPFNVAATAGNASAAVSWTAPSNGGSPITSYAITPFIGTTAQTPTTVTGSPPATSATVSGLTNGTSYTFRVAATNAVGTGPQSAASNAVTPGSSTGTCPCTIFGTSTPAVVDSGDASSVVLGVAFNADTNGSVTGIRFYKATTNTGTHIGTLWSSSGTALASATFSGETASGWQQVTFANPVAITAGTTYVASYLAPAGHYSYTSQAFASSGVDAPPLHALANSIHPNGVYVYSSSNAFPTSSYNATNYWVDLVLTQAAATVPGAPTNVVATAGNGSATVNWTAPSNGGSAITSYTITPYVGTTARASTTISGSPPATSATITGLTNGTTYTFKVSATNAIGTGPQSAASNAVKPCGLICL